VGGAETLGRTGSSFSLGGTPKFRFGLKEGRGTAGRVKGRELEVVGTSVFGVGEDRETGRIEGPEAWFATSGVAGIAGICKVGGGIESVIPAAGRGNEGTGLVVGQSTITSLLPFKASILSSF
jgi:hypothetical protein